MGGPQAHGKLIGVYAVRRTSRSKLREVDFEFDGQMLRGLDQNPEHEFPLGATSLAKARGSCSSSLPDDTLQM